MRAEALLETERFPPSARRNPPLDDLYKIG